MKYIVYLVLTLLSSSVVAFPGATKNTSDPALSRFIQLSKPQALEDVTFISPEGKAVKLSDYRGQPVMINLWATWCPPCVRELPSLERFRNDFEPQGMKVVPIATDFDPAIVKPFLAKLDLPEFATWYDSTNAMGKIVPTDLIPATYIINEQGQLVAFVRSFIDWDNPAVRQMMIQYLPKLQ